MAEAAAGKPPSGQGSSVQSLERALDILELLSRSESELGVTEIGPVVGLPSSTPYTITSAEDLKSELARIREQGYATDTEEMEEGVRCLAAPVFGPDGEVLAAMSISGPVSRLEESRIGELIPHVTRIAGDFTRSLNVPD